MGRENQNACVTSRILGVGLIFLFSIMHVLRDQILATHRIIKVNYLILHVGQAGWLKHWKKKLTLIHFESNNKGTRFFKSCPSTFYLGNKQGHQKSKNSYLCHVHKIYIYSIEVLLIYWELVLTIRAHTHTKN